jgi:hypothetical protein
VTAASNGPRPVPSLRVRLRGIDHAAAPALPLGEALHPVALAAVAVLLLNDWLLKPQGLLPGVITGKLSDLAGLAFAPVALSAALGVALHLAARLGAQVDPSLSRRRLLGCVLATGAGFAAVKLSPVAAQGFAALLPRAHVVVDPTDLLALPALAIAWAIGRDELRRVPLGRPAALHRLGRPAAAGLADVAWAGAPQPTVAALAAAIDRWDPAAIDARLVASSATR